MTKERASTRWKAYLAGPEVFLANATEIGQEKQEICRSLGLDSVFPYVAPDDPDDVSPEAGLRIFRRCTDWMRECHLAIANMTPFRGVSMDVGTAVELGFMHALDRPIFGYTNDMDDYDARVRTVSKDDMAVESFHFVDNLMCEGPVRLSGAGVVRGRVPQGDRFTDLKAFRQCVERAVEVIGQAPTPT